MARNILSSSSNDDDNMQKEDSGSSDQKEGRWSHLPVHMLECCAATAVRLSRPRRGGRRRAAVLCPCSRVHQTSPERPTASARRNNQLSSLLRAQERSDEPRTSSPERLATVGRVKNKNVGVTFFCSAGSTFITKRNTASIWQERLTAPVAHLWAQSHIGFERYFEECAWRLLT